MTRSPSCSLSCSCKKARLPDCSARAPRVVASLALALAASSTACTGLIEGREGATPRRP